MKKYKLQTKINQEILTIKINIPTGENTSLSDYHSKGIFIEKRKIIYQTFSKIALNDNYITTLDRQSIDQKKDSYRSYLNECTISIITKEDYFPNGIFGTIHTTLDEQISIKKLSQAMQRKIDKEYGWLSDLNVSNFVLENYNSNIK